MKQVAGKETVKIFTPPPPQRVVAGANNATSKEIKDLRGRDWRDLE